MHQGDGRYPAGSPLCISRLGGGEMNDYQVEIQVNKGKQGICLFPRLQAANEQEAKIKAKRFANSIGYWGTFKYRVFDGGPVSDNSELVF